MNLPASVVMAHLRKWAITDHSAFEKLRAFDSTVCYYDKDAELKGDAMEQDRRRTGVKGSYHLLGLAFWQAWWMTSMCTDIVLPSPPEASFPGTPSLWVMVMTTAAYLVVMLFSKKLSLFSSNKHNFMLAGILATFGSLSMSMALLYLNGPACLTVFIVGNALLSAGNALLLIMWGELWSTLATSRVGRHLYLSYAFSFILFLAVSFLPHPLSSFAAACFPGISALVLRSCSTEPRRSPSVIPIPEDALPIRNIIAAILLVSIIYGISQSFGVSFASDGNSNLFQMRSMIVAGLCIGLLTLDMILDNGTDEPLKLYRPVIPAFAAGLVLMLLLPSSYSFLGNGLIIVGVYCLDMLMMLVSTDVAFRNRVPVAFSFGLVILVARTGTLIGAFIANILLDSSVWSITLRNDIILVGILILLVASTLVFTQLDLRALYNVGYIPSQTTSLEDKCANISSMCSLSTRESEVLTLLARGRSIPYICDELSIAQGTAKHHVSSIYRKVGVCDRQGLHDVIESGAAGCSITGEAESHGR